MKIASRSSKLVASAVAALLASALLAAGAPAVTSPDQTRESYAAAVEPICKRNTKANEQILAGAEGEIKRNKLKVPARKFTQAAAAFGKAVNQLRAVPQPTADVAKLAKWLRYLGKEKALLGEIGKALKESDKPKVSRLSVQLDHNGNLANNAVLGFEFDYCLIESSRFS